MRKVCFAYQLALGLVVAVGIALIGLAVMASAPGWGAGTVR